MSKTALVTGASEGIGYEFCQLLAKDGYSVVLTARNQQRLEQRAAELQKYNIETVVIAEDLSKVDACKNLFRQLQEKNIEIDILINNAGFATFGMYSTTSLETETQLLQVNVVALTQLTKLFLPAMLKKGAGKIMNVGSMAGFVPGPGMAVYYASKAYVMSFSEALANELAGTGVNVTLLCPGPTTTEFQARAGMADSKLFKLVKPMTALAVAEEGYRGMMRSESIVITGAINQISAAITKFIPRKAVTAMVRRIQEER